MKSLLHTLFAVPLCSSAATAQASTCAVDLLSRPGCAAEHDLGLSFQQRQRLNVVRSQTQRNLSSLRVQLRRTDAALLEAQSPLRRRRLLQRKASLLDQLQQAKSRGIAQVRALLSPWQRRRCTVASTAYRPSIARPAGPAWRPKGKAGVRGKRPPVKRPARHIPYALKQASRRAPPSRKVGFGQPASRAKQHKPARQTKQHKPARQTKQNRSTRQAKQSPKKRSASNRHR